MPTALVVNPFVTDFKLYDEWMHPLGLYVLIDQLQQQGVTVHFCNCLERASMQRPRKYGTGAFSYVEIKKPALYSNIKRKYKRYGCSTTVFEQFLETLPPLDTIYLGSMMSYWIPGVLITAAILHRHFPTVPMVCGGIAATLMPHYFSEHLPELQLVTGALHAQSTSSLVPAPPTYSATFPSNHVPSLLPALKRNRLPHSPILLSLGCPLRCAYCASSFLQPSFEHRSLAMVLEEICYSATVLGIRDFSFYDDALLVRADEFLKPLLHDIIKKNLKIRLHTPNGLHLKYVTEPLLQLMYNAGFTTLRFGYESGSAKYKQQTNGKADRHLAEAKLTLVKKAGFADTGVYIMGGLQGSSPDEMADEMRYIASLGISVKPVFLSPVPHTKLFKAYQAQFPLLHSDPLWHNDTFFITQLPGWNAERVEIIRLLARELNAAHD